MKYILTLVAFLLSVASAGATTRYLDTVACSGNYSVVSRNCSGTGSGLSSYNNWTAVLNLTVAGDTIDVRGGSWGSIDTNSMPLNSGTDYTNAVTIKAHTGEKVVMTQWNLGCCGPKHHIIIDGFILDGGYEGISINNGNHHIRMQNLEIKNTVTNAISIFWTGTTIEATNNELLNSWIHHIGTCNPPLSGCTNTAGFIAPGTGLAHGVYITTSNNIIRGNRFDHIGEYAIHNWVQGHTPTGNIFDGNIITLAGQNTTRYGDITGCCGAIYVCCGSAHQITNNIIYGHNTGQGLLPREGIVMELCNNCAVYNNIIYNIRGGDINIYSGTGVIVKNNLTYLSGASPRR